MEFATEYVQLDFVIVYQSLSSQWTACLTVWFLSLAVELKFKLCIFRLFQYLSHVCGREPHNLQYPIHTRSNLNCDESNATEF